MKGVTAYIKPHKLSEVTLALQKIDGLTGASVSSVRGFGRCRIGNVSRKNTGDIIDYAERVRIEIVCRDDLVEKIVSAIEHAARTRLRGDGKIYVSDVQNAVRISTGERGDSAV